MTSKHDPRPIAAAGRVAGQFRIASPVGTQPDMDKWMRPGPLGLQPEPSALPKIPGVTVSGGALSERTITAINDAAPRTPAQWRRYIAYIDKVKVGGSIAWRANNPGNLRDGETKIGTVSGAVGRFEVFSSLEQGRDAQKLLYLSKYGSMTVRGAINKLTPPSENDTEGYLVQLADAGIKLDGDVKSQIDLLMQAVEANEGLIAGIEITRTP